MHEGTMRKLPKICGKYGIQTYFKATLQSSKTLIRPKDQDPKDRKSGVIYSYKCYDITCGEEYIGETSRSLGKGTTIYIRVNNPILNRNVGKYNLSHLWDRVLFNTPGLKIDSFQHPLHLHNNSLTQTIPANSQSPMATDTSEHALNSEHVLRDA